MNRKLKVLVSIAAVLVLCNSSVDVAGIQGSGRAAAVRGPITRFGSIFIDGVEYDTAAASIVVDDQPGSQAQLHIGQIVTLKGTVNDDGLTGTATEVAFDGTVAGPVQQVNASNNTFVVLGQKIHVNSSTLYSGGIQLLDLNALALGTVVEVSGFISANGDVVASYVDLAPSGGNLRVTGTVRALNVAKHTFRINHLTVDYSVASLGNPPANGDVVQVQGVALDTDGDLVAATVAPVPGLGAAPGDLVDLSGLITGVTSLLQFVVQGQVVIIDPFNTQLVLHGMPLSLNLSVTVQGTLTASGAILAKKIEVKAL